MKEIDESQFLGVHCRGEIVHNALPEIATGQSSRF
jgi:hypothetical protein